MINSYSRALALATLGLQAVQAESLLQYDSKLAQIEVQVPAINDCYVGKADCFDTNPGSLIILSSYASSNGGSKTVSVLPSTMGGWYQDFNLEPYDLPGCDLDKKPELCSTIFTNGKSWNGVFGGVGPAAQMQNANLDGSIWKLHYTFAKDSTPLYFTEFLTGGASHSPIRLRTDASVASDFKIYMVKPGLEHCKGADQYGLLFKVADKTNFALACRFDLGPKADEKPANSNACYVGVARYDPNISRSVGSYWWTIPSNSEMYGFLSAGGKTWCIPQ